MTTSPTPSAEGTARKPVPRYARGYVESYGQGRTCADPSCETTLSRYNKTTLCWKHAEQRRIAERRD